MSDITKGRTFGLTEQVTADKLHALIEDAVINPESITARATGTPAAADSWLFYSATGGALKKTTGAGLRTYVSPMTALAAVAIAAGNTISAVSFSARPTLVQAVLVCGTIDLGYAVGDEIPASAAGDVNGNPVFAWSCSATVANITCSTASFYLPNRGLAGYDAATAARWTIKLIAFTG